MSLRILLIEDNPTNLQLVTYLLTAAGHLTLPATTGREGIQLALTAIPDLILCDLALPDIDGYTVAMRLKREPALSKIPLIAVTASAMVGDRDKVIAAGFDGYISKPITPETFVLEVEAFANRGTV